MKKFSIIILTAFITFLAACYKDTGNYNYTDINEVKITGLANSYNVVLGADVLQIDPTVTPTLNPDTTRLSYYWIVYNASGPIDTLGTSRTLNSIVQVVPGSYTLTFRVVDNETGIGWTSSAPMVVNTRFSAGLMLMGTDINGNADMDMITMVSDTLIVRGILSNSGLPVLHDPATAVITGKDTARNLTRLWVMTKSGSYYLDRVTMTGTTDRKFARITVTNENLDKESLTPILFAPQVRERAGTTSGTGGRVIMTSDGNIFPTHTFLAGGDFYINPVNRVQNNYSKLLKTAPYLWYQIGGMTSFMWYDTENQRFMNYATFGTGTASTIPTDNANDSFPWNQSSLGRTLVYGENTRNTDGGSTNGNSFAIVKDNSNQYYIYKFLVNNPSPIKRDFYRVNGAIATDIDKATLFAFSSRRTVLFYAVGNTLYAYDYNRGFERSYTIPQITDEITMLKFDTQIDFATNALYIATYNPVTKGRLRRYMVGTNPNTVDITPVDRSDWNGLIKIKDMNWRGVN